MLVLGFFQSLLAGPDGGLDGRGQLTAAFLGGVASGVPCSIWELTMIQQQRFGGSMLGTPARLFSEGGLARLFRGVIPCIGRESLYTMAMLGVLSSKPVTQVVCKLGGECE